MIISCEQALELVLANLPERREESVPLRDAPGRVLAEPIRACCNIPPFNRAAMDGYALCSADVERAPAELEYAGCIRAGGGSTISLRGGQAAAIMTGAPVPEGADAVQMVERTERSADGRKVVILKTVKAGENIAPMGSEAAAGDLVLESGRLIGPAEMAVLATCGATQVRTWRKPRVALMVTGDELAEVEDTLRADQIRNSNAHSITAQLRLLNIRPDYLGIARDNKEELRARIGEGLQRDVLIMTGGVSVGEYDFAKEAFQDVGLEIIFSRVAMKPGKPTVFARKGEKLAFGLPGNPVSTFVSFENFVRPALGSLCGLKNPRLTRICAELLQQMTQVPGRTAFLPAWAEAGAGGWTVDPLRWKGSADIIGFARANAVIIFPAERELMAKGEMVEAMMLPDFFDRQR